ncbi:pilus assembly protein TadG-related protein [Yoonia sp.]|nr:pilus assembly protein TadG-related protein [Yoonia sp.]
MLILTKLNGRLGHNTRSKIALLKRLRSDERGGITILTLLLLITMLVVGGMAVDFMRFESKRVQLQSVSDRAVLAAADLGQTLSGEAVVTDFYRAAGFESNIIGVPTIDDTGNSRTVSVQAEIDVNTFYLRLIGIDTLTAPARSSAIEGIGKVEISLVLDISGSMRYDDTNSKSKFENMQDAAISFANKVLDPNNGGQVSLNIVPYAGGTNIGREMFSYLDFNRTTANVDYDLSSCVELVSEDWTNPGMPGTKTNPLNAIAPRAQVPHFMRWDIAADVMDWGWCPQDKSSIQYAISEPWVAESFIRNMRMHDGTGTHYAMKYGLAALDPTTQAGFEHLNSRTMTRDRVVAGATISVTMPMVADKFNNRPAAWDDSETRKIIVLMTDGAITQQFRPNDPTNEGNSEYILGNSNASSRTEITSTSDNVDSFDDICIVAKSTTHDVEVYTVAFNVQGAGSDQMRDCASEPKADYFYSTSGAGLTDVFNNIASQITDLRLNL